MCLKSLRKSVEIVVVVFCRLKIKNLLFFSDMSEITHRGIKDAIEMGCVYI